MIDPQASRPARDRGLVITAAVAAVLVALGTAAIVWINSERPLPTLGPSMQPTLSNRSSVDVDYEAYENALPQLGDIVVVQAPDGYQGGCGVQSPRQAAACADRNGYSFDRLLKRVVGLPGDTIGFDAAGVVIRNGVRQDETRIRRCARACPEGPVEVGSGMYFLAGDNRPVSADSRLFGPLPLGSIDGRVILDAP